MVLGFISNSRVLLVNFMMLAVEAVIFWLRVSIWDKTLAISDGIAVQFSGEAWRFCRLCVITRNSWFWNSLMEFASSWQSFSYVLWEFRQPCKKARSLLKSSEFLMKDSMGFAFAKKKSFFFWIIGSFQRFFTYLKPLSRLCLSTKLRTSCFNNQRSLL